MNDEQLQRYSRQMLLPQIDLAGQQKLLAARVLVIGLGGLGSPLALYLAAAGVGQLVITDDDRVDLSNLQRQIMHRTQDIGRAKTESARAALSALNPDIKIITIAHRLAGDELAREVALAGHDLGQGLQIAARALCGHARQPPR